MLDSCVEGAARTHQRILEIVEGLSPEQLRGDSRLPGWTRNHVIGHLTMNAFSHVHLFACAGRGEVGEQYPGGAESRAEGIEEAARWDPERARAELRRAIYTLEGAWAGASADAWNGTAKTASGALVSVHELPFLRWRESVVHLTDLDVGVGHDEWPPYYVRLELDRQKMAWAASHPMGLTQLPAAAMKLDEHHRLAWLLRRADVDGLPEGPGL